MREILKECKMRGLSLKADGARAIEAYVRTSKLEAKECLHLVIQIIRGFIEAGDIGSNTLIDGKIVNKATAQVERQTSDGDALMEEADNNIEKKMLKHLDAWSCQELYYDIGARKYMLKDGSHSHRHGNAASRVTAYRSRYELSWERVSRNPGFAPRWSAAATYLGTDANQNLRLERLDALRSTRDGGTVCVLGVLVQADDEAATIELEDPYSSAIADVSHADCYGGGYFTEGMIVVAEGQFDATTSIFRIGRLGHPPPETRIETIKALGGPRLSQFGNKAHILNNSLHATPWIILSEPHLDSTATLPKFRRLIEGLLKPAAQRAAQQQVSGPVLIICGDFTSIKAEAPAHAVRSVQARFAELATLLSSPEFDINNTTPLLAHLTIIFVPGPRDLVCGPNRLLPRDKLPDSILQPFFDKIQRRCPQSLVIASTTPCRLQTPFGNEIIIHRQDTLKKLRRLSARLLPSHFIGNKSTSARESPTGVEQDQNHHFDNPGPHLAKTIIDQAHLAPFSLSLAPIYWEYDHALRLYPSPNALILADDSAPRFNTKYNDVVVANPGSFARDAAFLVLNPYDCSLQPSVIPS
mmetsp:Transcript_21937/g.33831  ORF Transcript_21937/g.33831 Transcript_21937/m.33831 type:complete len:584 (-) Transcript_21937:125-1876(-)